MATAAVPKRRISPAQRREWLEGYLFAAPFLIGFTVFVAFPMLYSIWLMFQRWDLLSAPEFVGFRNIQRAFTDELALKSLLNSALYTIFAVPVQLVISFSLAYALTQKIKFRSLYRAGFYLPIIIPIVATAVVWQRVFHPDFGILNNVLGWFGIPPQAWLLKPELAKPAFILMSFWMIGRQMVIFIAGPGQHSHFAARSRPDRRRGPLQDHPQDHHPPDDAAHFLQHGDCDHQLVPDFRPVAHYD